MVWVASDASWVAFRCLGRSWRWSCLEQSLASPGARIGARVIDFIIFIVISLVFLLPAIGDLFEGSATFPRPTDGQVEAVFEDASMGGASTSRWLRSAPGCSNYYSCFRRWHARKTYAWASGHQ